MSTSNAPVGETLEYLVARFLRTVPQTWTEYDVSALSELEERALFLLTGAGMIERRTFLRLQMFGHPVAVEATITLTGECGFAEAMEYFSARMWDEWRGVFEKRKASDQKDAPAFHCERIGKEQWRLTAEGLVARGDLDNGNSSTVFDFVLNRGFFAARPLVQGQGKLEKMTLVNPNAGPTGVNIANWEDGGKAFAAAFAELVKSHAATPNGTQQGEGEKPQADADAETPQYVTLDQMAALVNRSKKTLEREMNAKNTDMPKPDVEGGGGKPHEWRWDRIRPWLETKYARQLPVQFPTA